MSRRARSTRRVDDIIPLVRSVIAGAAVLIAAATACSPDGDGSRSTTEPAPTLEAAACPATDEAFCDTAAAVAHALASKNAAGLVELSRADTIDCAEVRQEYFPQCGTDDVLVGHGFSDADLIVELLTEAAYRERARDDHERARRSVHRSRVMVPWGGRRD